MCRIMQLAGGEIVKDLFFSWHIGMYALRRQYVLCTSLLRNQYIFFGAFRRGVIRLHNAYSSPHGRSFAFKDISPKMSYSY